jgi:hypothetical protein
MTVLAQTAGGNGANDGKDGATDGGKAFVGALVTAARNIEEAPAGDPKVIAAIQLGWLAADLANDRPIGRLDGEDLDPRTACKAQAIRLSQLCKTLGLDDPALTTTSTRLSENDGASAADSVRLWDVVAPLLGGDARLARGYLLGRALNDLRNTPYVHGRFGTPETTRIVERLDQLSSVLPPHAGRGVANAVRRWCEYEEEPRLDGEDPPKPQDVLQAQCDLWYRVLTGQKRAVELLEPANYTDAGVRLAKKIGGDLWRVVAPVWPTVLGAIVVLAAGFALLLAGAGGTGTTAAGLSAIIAAFGLTWKGVGGTIGKLVGNLEGPLWNAELDGAVTEAALLLPQKARPESRRERRNTTLGGDYAGRARRVQREGASTSDASRTADTPALPAPDGGRPPSVAA